MKVLGVAGSLRAGSYSTLAVAAVLAEAQKHGAEIMLLDLRTAELPMYQPDIESYSQEIQAIMQQVNWADTFVLGTPDYHGSMSGALKNFLDYHWEEFAGKLFGYICASHEKGLTVMDQMRTAVRQCYGWSLPYGISIHGEHDLAADGTVSNPRLASRLAMLGRDLVVYGELLRNQFQQDIENRAGNTFASRYAT